MVSITGLVGVCGIIPETASDTIARSSSGVVTIIVLIFVKNKNYELLEL
jgi:hypothetical protein